MKPGFNGIPPDLFKKCKGVILLSVIEVGFIFSGNVGTGIILAKKPDGSWSVPCACGLTGVGWGFLVGGSVKDLFVFLMNDSTLASALADTGIKFGGQAEFALGPFGRSGKVDIGLSGGGVGGTVAIAFAKGAFIGLSVEGAVVGVRNAVNASFYGKEESPRNIVLSDAVSMPEGKVTLINDVYEKLAKLSEGKAEEPTEENEAKKSAAKSAVEQAAASAKDQPDVVKVDAAAEAAKESS
jgi:lipid-binding SYLF domain-containing protein